MNPHDSMPGIGINPPPPLRVDPHLPELTVNADFNPKPAGIAPHKNSLVKNSNNNFDHHFEPNLNVP